MLEIEESPPMPFYYDIFISCKRFPESWKNLKVPKSSIGRAYIQGMCQCQMKPLPALADYEKITQESLPIIKTFYMESKRYSHRRLGRFLLYFGQCIDCGRVFWDLLQFRK